MMGSSTNRVADSAAPDKKKRPGLVRRFIENRLIGNFDSADFSEPWKRKFAHAPTWCDADMAMQQIQLGTAVGNPVGLYSRAFFQLWLYRLGCVIQKYAWTTIIVTIALYTACCFGLQDVIIETDIVKLWVSQDGRLNEELTFLARIQEEATRIKRQAEPEAPHVIELPKENGLGGGFQVVIQTPTHPGENVLSKKSLLKHVDLMEEISKYEVHLYGEKWTLADICFKPPGPSFNVGPLSKVMNTMMDKIIPCIWITPIDCYWEGAKPLGPNPPLNLGEEISSFVSSLPKGNVTWKNLNPTAVMDEVGSLFDLGPIGNFFERAGIGSAYLDRPCIDPLDAECPKTAPNYFDRCAALEKFTAWNMAREDRVQLEKTEVKTDEEIGKKDVTESIINEIFGRKKRETKETKKDEDYYAYDEEEIENDVKNSTASKKKKMDPKDLACMEYGPGLLKWMAANPTRWGEFLTAKELPREPDYSKVMTGGCKGFGKNIMEWPEDLIIGGIKRENEELKSAEALQSVFLVASAFDVYLRFKDGKSDRHPNLNTATWNPGYANEVLVGWQRNFTKKLYKHKANFETENNRVFHPLASTSIADMLEEFSQFNYFIIVMGYFLMIIYAAWTQARWEKWWFSVQSNVFLSFIGVFLVTYSSICGLGVTTWLGINFNAATTQIVPFLTLGLGIDDMFLLLHNYDEIRHIATKNEMGILLKETGLSVMVTSANNILAFCAGYVLPIPALRSFCSQTAILLFFNLASLVFIFPAFIALDLKRMRAGKRDLVFCSKGTVQEEKSGIESTASSSAQLTKTTEVDFQRDQPWYTVGGFLTYYYIPALKNAAFRWAIILLTIASVGAGVYGLSTSTLGLELSDVLPENTPPAAFLRAREKYFSFYPMFAVLRGKTIDIPNSQKLIEEYREALGKSHFMIKNNGKLQPYWMSLLRTWVQSLDAALDKELKAGNMDPVTGFPVKGKDKPAPEALIARKMLCSFGTQYNCTGRIGKVRLVSEDGIINPEGFYNYLTGWYNVDNMMYYVSQASFFPNPPGWAMGPDEKVVPPAKPLLYSQIPFYQTDLTDTPPIVKMIEEIRSTCDEFTAKGLPNFPSGLAFTFWEQYLSLRWNLFCAIVIIAFSVFAVISVLMFNPWAAGLVMIIVVIITIELGGFMGLLAVKMNPISAVTLICAVGIGVEFTAHVVLNFMTTLGTMHERLESCLQHMFVPVFHGAISTFLGIVMLVFSEFDFVIKYFFVVMSVLVALGIFNGLCLLPVLLIEMGPQCELQPADGSNRLSPPPPLAEQKKNESVEGGLRQRKGAAEVEMAESPTSQ